MTEEVLFRRARKGDAASIAGVRIDASRRVGDRVEARLSRWVGSTGMKRREGLGSGLILGGGLGLGKLSRLFDSKVIDGVAVNGSAGLVGLAAGLVRKLQSGYLYHYAFAMILGLVALLALANHYWL